MTQEQTNILFYVVVILFVITFIFTLFAIANKIKIDQKMKYGLYSAFILELAVAFFGFLTMKAVNDYETYPDKDKWVGLELESMTLVQPKLLINSKSEDTSGVKNQLLGRKVEFAKDKLKSTIFSSELTSQGLEIFLNPDDKHTLGIVPKDSLKLFNQINLNEATLIDKYRKIVTFYSKNSSKWKTDSKFFVEPGYDIEVSDKKSFDKGHWITGYIITQKKGDSIYTLFNSDENESTRDRIDKGKRIIHSYEHDNKFYLIFISSSSLVTDTVKVNRHIQFHQLQLVPNLNTN